MDWGRDKACIHSIIAANDITEEAVNKPYCLSASLEKTRKFVIELQEILDEQRVPPKKVKIQNPLLEY